MTPPRLVALLLAMVSGLVLGTVADVAYQATGHSAPSVSIATGTVQAGKSAGGQASTTAASGPLDTATIAEKVDPAVVDIFTILADGSGQAAGTGMVITSSGEVLTNNHVIDGASRITAQVGGSGRTYSATVVGADAADDVAVIQLQGAADLQTITVGDSSRAAVGDTVVVIGNALGRGGTPAVSQGAIAGLNQTITVDDGTRGGETLRGLIQVRALIQPGDSGGPLVDAYGNVIGMDTAAQVGGGRGRANSGSNNGFAIPINAAMSIAQQLDAGASTIQA